MTHMFDNGNRQPPKAGLLLLQIFILGLFCVFALRLWYLQIHRGEEYAVKARENQLRQEPVFAPRGLILDRNGELLAVNEPAYALGLVREDCKDIKATLAQVAHWTGVPVAELQQRFAKGRKRVKPFEALILIPDLSFDQMAVIEANRLHWPGLDIRVRPRRHYKYGTLMAHILGYVSEANEAEMEKDPKLALGDEVGKQGLELMLERALRGSKGRRQFEVDVNGRKLDERVLRSPRAGQELALSIDLHLQQLIMDWLEGEAGAVVVMDADTGQLHALVSSPSFDSNAFSSGLSPEQWATLRDDPMHPLQNRAIQSVYPPGSVFKLCVAGAGLSYNMVDPRETVFCNGALKLGRHVFRCWRRGGHGKVNFERALVESCDVYFYKLGKKLGVDRMSTFANACGYGVRTGIRLPHEKSGNIATREWKRRRFGERWQGGDDLNMAIGQGFTLVSPLQVARFVAAMVNGGKLLKPQLLKDDKVELLGRVPLNKDQLAMIRKAMHNTVAGAHGTARRLRTKGVDVGGKTGTAQVVRLTDELKKLKDKDIPYKYRDHAWMCAYAEKGDRRYAIAALVEHGLHGGSGAGPVVKAVIEYLFNGVTLKRPERK
ncbi:penicillin-binding protein 2 [Pseudodesulfovibrio senegalensis]|uniref:Penicillin-binding protein 2 n=1 Tax=Pseudodesulfovibrio senegalensis TaxID=1721087 RepID=A0A6N6N450_9BACT|nr:penicillin-binding protein 2 [Pseudodesulfovibrio senegalensis]KAB1441863.1 penicillin-binding protein 2 [Pseudodesulfovibrio senegalensis]